MNYSEVKELLQAGFTAEEIRGMLTTPPDNPQNPQENPQPKQPEKQPEQKQPEEQPEPKPQEKPQDDIVNQFNAKFNELNATMEKLTKTIQHNNLNNNSFDKMKETDIDTKVDQIMAGIIRPEREKGGN